MKTLLVVGGAFDFTPDFPDFHVVRRSLNGAKWLLRDDNTLFFLDGSGAIRVDAALWRVGAICPLAEHRHVLELLRLAHVPCVNSPQTLLRGFERLSMLAELREVGVPMLPFSLAMGEGALEATQPELPCVLKVGNWHGGIGKARLETLESWLDARDLALAAPDYATTEAYVAYKRDVRVMIIGEKLWAMERRTEGWKVNRGQAQPTIIPVPDEPREWTQRVQKHLGADILGLDWIETSEGDWLCLESNDVPGLSGWPDEIRKSLVAQARLQFTNHR